MSYYVSFLLLKILIPNTGIFYILERLFNTVTLPSTVNSAAFLAGHLCGSLHEDIFLRTDVVQYQMRLIQA